MLVTQLHALVNSATKAVLGETAVLNEDLSNVVDIGNEVFSSDKVDNYVKKLVDHIGKVIFVNRVYSGGAPSILMDSWEFGSVLQKVSADLPDAEENDSWALIDGQEYSQDVFKAPKVSAKFFNSKVTFEIQMSFVEEQLKSAFSSAEQLNGFISMLVNSVENSLTVKLDALIMRSICNMAAEVYQKGGSSNKVNLLAEYNALKNPDNLTGGNISARFAMMDNDFIRYATMKMGLISDRMTKISKLFNVNGKARFTSKDDQRVILLSDFGKASETYVLSDAYNKDVVTLPSHDSVPYWQGSGTDYDFDSTSKIDVKTSSGELVELSGLLGVIFDKDAVAVSNMNKRTTVAYNSRGEFYNNWFKVDAQYINDLSENCVIFYIADI